MKYKFYISDNTPIYLKELTLKGYKEIIKASYGDDVSISALSDTIISVLTEHSDKENNFFETLNLCDLMDILIEIRSNSMGNISTILVPAEEDKQIKVDLRLDWIQEDIRELASFCKSQTLTINNLTLYYGCPSISKLLGEANADEQFLNFLESAQVKEGDKQAFLRIDTIENGRKILNALSAKEGNTIIETFYTIAKFINSQDAFLRYKIKTKEKLRFVPNAISFIWFVKLLYNDSLDSIYNNLFMLSKYANISPTYLEECTPGEYMFFVRRLEDDFKMRENEAEEDVDLH